jgi:AAA ATPase domain
MTTKGVSFHPSPGGQFSAVVDIHGILGRDAELAQVTYFLESVSGRPSALMLEGTAGIGKTTLWHAAVSLGRARGHRVLTCHAAEPEARLSYAALGDLFDFELPDLPAPQKRALDAALLRAEVGGAPPDRRAVSVASLGVLRTLAASGPVIVAIDDVQWLDVPSARVLAFVVRRLHRISGGNPLFALEIARALTGQGIRPAPGEPLPVPGDLQQLLAARLAALPSGAADVLLVVAAAARPT